MSPMSKDENGWGSSYFTQNSPDKPCWLRGRHHGSGTPPPGQLHGHQQGGYFTYMKVNAM